MIKTTWNVKEICGIGRKDDGKRSENQSEDT